MAPFPSSGPGCAASWIQVNSTQSPLPSALFQQLLGPALWHSIASIFSTSACCGLEIIHCDSLHAPCTKVQVWVSKLSPYMQTSVFASIPFKHLKWSTSNLILPISPIIRTVDLQKTRFSEEWISVGPIVHECPHILLVLPSTQLLFTDLRFHIGFSLPPWPCLSPSMHCPSPLTPEVPPFLVVWDASMSILDTYVQPRGTKGTMTLWGNQPSANAEWESMDEHPGTSPLAGQMQAHSEVPAEIRTQLPTAVTNATGLAFPPRPASLPGPSLLLSGITFHSNHLHMSLVWVFFQRDRQYMEVKTPLLNSSSSSAPVLQGPFAIPSWNPWTFLLMFHPYRTDVWRGQGLPASHSNTGKQHLFW